MTAAGATIDNGAQFDPSDLGSSTLTVEASFIALNNTAATAIVGTFGNCRMVPPSTSVATTSKPITKAAMETTSR